MSSPPPAEEEAPTQKAFDINSKDPGWLEAQVYELMDLWNGLPPPIAKVKKLTGKRRKAAMARMAETGWYDEARRALDIVETDPFYRGSGGRGWVANFDWFCRPDTVQKLIEKLEGLEAMQRHAAP